MSIGNGLANFITGNGGNNNLDGGALNDTLNGGEGNDSLFGGTGNDKMTGGKGDDAYVVDSKTDVVTEGAGAGNDYVVAYIDYTLGANVEGLKIVDGADIKGTGNTLANDIVAGNGNNKLDGAGGNDTLKGGIGNDTLIGGAGKDALWGEAGNDQMKGGLGDDVYVVEDAGDTVVEVAGQGKDLIITSLTSFDLTTNGANVEGLIYTGSSDTTLTGNILGQHHQRRLRQGHDRRQGRQRQPQRRGQQ